MNTGSSVSLAGSASQADNHTLTYLWSQTGGPAVVLSNAALLNPSFTAPASPATLTFTLTATDTQNPNPAVASTTSSPVTIHVNAVVATPKLDVSSARVVEGNGSTRPASFRVTLSKPATSTVTVNYTVAGTGDNPATVAAKKTVSGADVLGKLAGTLTFKVNTRGVTPTMKAITLQVLGDIQQETDEDFAITITGVSGGGMSLADVRHFQGMGTGTILNDDDNPPAGLQVSVGDAAIVEGDSGSRSLAVPVTLSDVPGVQVTVPWSIDLGTGLVWGSAKVTNRDIAGKLSGTLTFKALGPRTKYVSIPIISDTTPEGTLFGGLYLETATVHLDEAHVVGATVFRNDGVVAIVDDDH